MKRKIILVLTCMLLLVISGCNKNETPKSATSVPKLKVMATVYPVYEFVRQVGGDKVDVSMLVPIGAEPHDWEPSAKDMIKLKEAKAVFFHGAGFESWSSKLLSKDNLGGSQAIEVSKGLPLLKQDHEEEPGHSHSQGHSHDQDTDPHVWLDPVLAQQQVRIIAAALGAIDATNKDYYEANAQRYIAELETLHQEFQAAMSQVNQRSFITNHAAFGYLAARYNLKQLSIMGLSPDAEPTPDKMAKLVTLVREHKIKYVFAETVVSSKLAETIARETGAKVLLLHPIDQLTESEWKTGQNYLSIMRANLSNLKKATAE